jgi:broad specificity phosphatase PhoE
MIAITFIRHAESTSNAGLRTKHPALTPLTERGYIQAAQTALAFDSAPSLIVVSPYVRTRQTAQPLMERFPAVPMTEWPVQEFTFLAPQHWDGTTVEERRPAAHTYWERGDPFYWEADGAESFADLMRRVQQTQDLIRLQKDGFVIVFSHGEFIRAFWWRILFPKFEINAEAMRRYRAFIHAVRFPNCAFLKFRFDGDEVWNSSISTSHLSEEL